MNKSIILGYCKYMEMDTTIQNQNPVEAPQNQPPQYSIINQKGFSTIIIGIVILLLVVGAGIYLLNRKNNKTSTETNSNQLNNSNTPVTSNFPDFIYYTNVLYWQDGDHATHIYRYDPNTKQEVEILTIPTTKSVNLSRMSLSPNEKQIAYSLFEQTVIGTGAPNKNRQLWLVNSDGTNQKLIYEDKSDGSIFDYLTWSPDSKSLIFYNNSSEPYKVSIDTAKVDKMASLPGRIAGWFSNNKIGFEQAKPTGCPSEDECYPSYKAILTDPDGTQPQEVYDPPIDYDSLTSYVWLKDGSGLIKIDRKGLAHYDFQSKNEVELTKFSTQQGGHNGLIMFPHSKSALILIRDEEITLYKLDLTSNKLTKVKTFSDNVYLVSISDDEKYFLVNYGNTSQGIKIQKGLEVYDLNGNLIEKTPYKRNIEPLGFVQ